MLSVVVGNSVSLTGSLIGVMRVPTRLVNTGVGDGRNSDTVLGSVMVKVSTGVIVAVTVDEEEIVIVGVGVNIGRISEVDGIAVLIMAAVSSITVSTIDTSDDSISSTVPGTVSSKLIVGVSS